MIKGQSIKLVKHESRVDDLLEVARKLHLDHLWVKREDLINPRFGGSKVRNFEKEFEKALQADSDSILLTARAGSNAVAAASVFGRDFDLSIYALLKPQVHSKLAEYNLNLIRKMGTQIRFVPQKTPLHIHSKEVTAELDELKKQGKKPYFVNFGGSSDEAAAEHAVELASTFDQFKYNGKKLPDRLYVAGASFTLAAGLAAGLKMSRAATQLVIVGVAHYGEPYSVLEKKVPAILEILNMQDVEDHRLQIDFRCAFDKAFGIPFPLMEIEANAEIAALELDEVYVRPTFHQLIQDAESKKISRPMFWNSGNPIKLELEVSQDIDVWINKVLITPELAVE
jgi:1-aminocyclopropane-1-carboxylate deaminase/D-cysteine desulfhydrase-like pyridoxal-dependent ACC family enzyme